jgi:hypothetical protein
MRFRKEVKHFLAQKTQSGPKAASRLSKKLGGPEAAASGGFQPPSATCAVAAEDLAQQGFSLRWPTVPWAQGVSVNLKKVAFATFLTL